MAVTIPSPDDLDGAWFTARLRDAGHDVTVRGVQYEPIGTGQVGRCFRYSLDYASEHGGAPVSLVAKFSAIDPVSRESGRALRTYLTETIFYRDIAAQVRVRVPHCYYAAIDDEGLEHVILMEDLAPGRQGDQIAGCSVEVARQAVLEIAGLHGPTFNDARWYALLGRVEDGPFADMKALYNSTLPGFLDRFGERLDPGHVAVIERIGACRTCPMFDLSASPFSLEHYDYRLDNVIIDESVSPPRVTAVDWQSVRVGKPLNDVAYFLGSALEPEVRRAVEMDLLRDYHGMLARHGVTDFAFDACLREYRKGVFAGFAVTVVAAVLVEQTARGDAMFTAMARRYGQMAIDLAIDEFMR